MGDSILDGVLKETAQDVNTNKPSGQRKGTKRNTDQELKAFLRRPGALKYFDLFKECGIDTVAKALELDYSDLEELNIPQPLRGRILSEITFRKNKKKGNAATQAAGEAASASAPSNAKSSGNNNSSSNGRSKGGNAKSNDASTSQQKRKRRSEVNKALYEILKGKTNVPLPEVEAKLTTYDARVQEHVKSSGGLKAYIQAQPDGAVVMDTNTSTLTLRKKSNKKSNNKSEGGPAQTSGSKSQSTGSKSAKAPITAEELQKKVTSLLEKGPMKISKLQHRLRWHSVKSVHGPITSFLSRMSSISCESTIGGDLMCKLNSKADTSSSTAKTNEGNEKRSNKRGKKVREFNPELFSRSLVKKIRNSADNSMSVKELERQCGARSYPEWASYSSSNNQSLALFCLSQPQTFHVKEMPSGDVIVSLAKATAVAKAIGETSGKHGSGSSGRNSEKQSERQVLVRDLAPSVSEESIVSYFSKYGNVVGFKWNTRDTTQQGRRSCLMTFSESKALQTIKQVSRHAIQGEEIEVKTLLTGLTSKDKKSAAAKTQQSGVVLCCQNVAGTISDQVILETFEPFGCFGITRKKQKHLAFIYLLDKQGADSALSSVKEIGGKSLQCSLASRQEGVPTILSDVNVVSSHSPRHSPRSSPRNSPRSNRGSGRTQQTQYNDDESKAGLGISPESTYLWMKEEKSGIEPLDLNASSGLGGVVVSDGNQQNNGGQERDSIQLIESSTQALISRAVETRNEINELIRSVKLEHIMPEQYGAAPPQHTTTQPGLPPYNTNPSQYNPVQPTSTQFNTSQSTVAQQSATQYNSHQPWADPLGFNTVNTVASQQSKSGSLEVEGKDHFAVFQEKEMYSSSSANTTQQNQQIKNKASEKSQLYELPKELPKHSEEPKKLAKSKPTRMVTVSDEFDSTFALSNTSATGRAGSDHKGLTGHSGSQSQQMQHNNSAGKRQVANKSSGELGAFELNVDSVKGRDSSWRKNASEQVVNKKEPVAESGTKEPAQQQSKPVLNLSSEARTEKKSSWAALTKKQTGVGPRLVSLKAAGAKITSWADAKDSTPLSSLSRKPLTTQLTHSSVTQQSTGSSTSSQQQQQQSSQQPAAQQPKRASAFGSSSTARDKKPMSSLAKLAAKQEVKNADFPALSSVKLADGRQRNYRNY